MPQSTRQCTIDGCASTVHGHDYCAKHYKRWKKNGDPLHVAVADCDRCGSPFALGTRGVPSMTCPDCREVARRAGLYDAAKTAAAERFESSRKSGICQDCAEPFERSMRDTNSTRCIPCRAIERRIKGRAWEKRNPEKMALTDRRRQQLKAAKHRRRVLIRNAPSDKFLSVDIFERDGWACQICGLVIDPQVKFPSNDSASLDHIIPISLGGTHTLNNVQLACMGCNRRKGARMAA